MAATTNQVSLTASTFIDQTGERQACLGQPQSTMVGTARNPTFISQRVVEPYVYAATTLQNYSWWLML